MGFVAESCEAVFFPPAAVPTAMAVPALVGLFIIGLMEMKGKHLQYSKFWNAPSSVAAIVGSSLSGRVSARVGMLSIYTPALAASLAAFPAGFAFGSARTFLVSCALALHFAKRDLEVMFLHRFSGQMAIDTMIPISMHYFIFATGMIYGQYLTSNLPEPSINLTYVGVALFLVGVLGNGYHHYLLSKLRGKEDKEYKIPKGGLFSLVVCPHYLFEIVDFFGMALISQTWASLAFALATVLYLAVRSIVTRKWYMSKFEDFPKEVKALVPFVF